MPDSFAELVAAVGWPKLLIAGLFVLIPLAPRGLAGRAGSVALAVAAAGLLVYLDWVDHRRAAAEIAGARGIARTAVIEQRQEKIEATKTKRIIDVMARQLVSTDARAVRLHDAAIAYDRTLADDYVAAFLAKASPEDSPMLAATRALRVFVNRIENEIPAAGDNVLYFLARDYERVFRTLKDVDPQACPAFLQGQTLLSSQAQMDVFGAAAVAFGAMQDKTRPASKGTPEDAMAFGERTLGPERWAKLRSLEQPMADTCTDLADIYAAVHMEGAPSAFAAARYWLQPYRLFAP